jgi:hypothetical protein
VLRVTGQDVSGRLRCNLVGVVVNVAEADIVGEEQVRLSGHA